LKTVRFRDFSGGEPFFFAFFGNRRVFLFGGALFLFWGLFSR
jgi:hypothetical protein